MYKKSNVLEFFLPNSTFSKILANVCIFESVNNAYMNLHMGDDEKVTGDLM